MITLVGVGHVFDLEASLRRVIEARRPAVVGVELDPARFHALQAGDPTPAGIGVYTLIAHIQRRIAREYGSRAGSEMLAAARAARDVDAKLAFLDLDSRDVLARLLRSMSLREKVRFAMSVLGGLFVRKERVEREIERFEADEKGFLAEVAAEFPSVKKVLIDERDAHMAGALRRLEADHGSVLAVVGEGHMEGLRALLGDRSPELVRLRDLRTSPDAGAGNASVTFTMGP